MIPEGTTHTAEFYGRTLFYKKVGSVCLNTLIYHPTEQWQKVVK